jgi:hypothetical protein
MLQDILNVEGVTVLTKEQQKNVTGGGESCTMNDISQPGNHQYLYSPTGFYLSDGSPEMVAVSESCKWTCRATDRKGNPTGSAYSVWGGCGL